MVVFTCNQCGESLKKNKVDLHCRRCRTYSLSCVDCLQDFTLQSYGSHLECITEDQKYGDQSYQQKEFKGKVKQNEWVQKIKAFINENKFPREVQNILKSLVNYNNIPRKKAKFANFVRNSFRIRDEKLIDTIWDIFEKSIKGNGQPNMSNGQCNEQTPNGNTKRALEDINIASSENDLQYRQQEQQEKRQKIDVTQQVAENVEVKFKFKHVVKDVITKYNKPISLNKLKKKVFKQCQRLELAYDYDKVERKVNKLIQKPTFVLDGDKVTLAD